MSYISLFWIHIFIMEFSLCDIIKILHFHQSQIWIQYGVFQLTKNLELYALRAFKL